MHFQLIEEKNKIDSLSEEVFLMKNSNKVTVPILAWYGEEELELEFPESWDVTLCKMKNHGAPALTDVEIRRAFTNPIGTKTIQQLAKGKKEIAILFDDMSRPTPTAQLIPYVLEELAAAGIPDANIRFIAAIGAHGAMNGIDFRKKLGDEVMGRFLIYNHNPYENCTPLGMTSQGTPVSINSEVMSCDLKIGIGCIVPHPSFGFGGGSKIIIAGVASMETIDANHTRLGLSPTTGTGKYEDNVQVQDMNEAARMAGLDVKIDVILNLKREITALFIGDPVEEHKEGVKFAKEHYATDMAKEADVVIANCYLKADEMVIASGAAAPLLSQNGGDMILIAITPEGQVNHYLIRTYGKNIGGRAWFRKTGLPRNTKKLTIMSPYSDRVGADWVAPYEHVTWAKTWTEVINDLKSRYGDNTKVTVVPDATVQYFPEAPKIQEQRYYR